jgi:hypothetical protein
MPLTHLQDLYKIISGNGWNGTGKTLKMFLVQLLQEIGNGNQAEVGIIQIENQ